MPRKEDSIPATLRAASPALRQAASAMAETLF